MFDTICVGFDGSEPSENAVRMACALAVKHGSALHIVHTPRPDTVAFALGAVAGYHAATMMPTPEETTKSAEISLEKARRIAAKAGKADVETHVGQGEPAEFLVSYARDCGADLIVTGRRGLGHVTALMLGSTSYAVAQLADCPHLTVR